MENERPYMLLPSYPHMAVADTAIWERFVRDNPDAYQSVAYDVAVGGSAPFDTVVNPLTGASVARLYQRRIDVVGFDGSRYDIIEVKPRASTAALGQLTGYRTLFMRDFPQLSIGRALIITDALLPDMELLAQQAGISIVVV